LVKFLKVLCQRINSKNIKKYPFTVYEKMNGKKCEGWALEYFVDSTVPEI
jgi:hypothetical protein